MFFSNLLFPNFKQKAFTLSYDDGGEHDKRLVEITSKYGVKGTFNLNSGFLGEINQELSKEIKSLYIDSGNEVAIHGEFHLCLPDLNEERMVAEIYNDRRNLEKLTGQMVTGMAYAGGAYNDKVISVLKVCGVDYSRTTDDRESFDIHDDWLRLGATCHHDNPRLFDFAKEFLDEKSPQKPMLFYVWGHSYEFYANDNWDRIEKLLKTVGGKEDVWYATNIEIVRYVEAFKALRFSLDGKTVYNPTGIDVFMLTERGARVKALSGQTLRL